ncbi:helix-turn-helix domain-containing protein [Curtobacterium sp. S6]|uniref:helix-turn-helix domain-containing protein n=1 Tax=Curtobacterium sp. S6 TaxID=1479623 RepID=UPI000AD132F3|nr:helix-turn-helix domain-containing protein [Curtobacterium sp. S6]
MIAAVNSGMSMTEAGKLHGVSRWTVQRAMQEEGSSPDDTSNNIQPPVAVGF